MAASCLYIQVSVDVGESPICSMLTFQDNWMNNKVLAKVAYTPTGPWSDPVTLYQAMPITNGSSIYAAVPHPYYDESGRNLIVTFTNHPNLIQAVNVVSPPGAKLGTSIANKQPDFRLNPDNTRGQARNFVRHTPESLPHGTLSWGVLWLCLQVTEVIFTVGVKVMRHLRVRASLIG